MPPKKQTTASNEIASPSSDAPEGEENNSKADSTASAAPRKVPTHPSTMIMIKEALKELDSRKGVSTQAIRTSIAQKYPTVDLVRLKYMVRKALIKGLENGMLVRPAKSTVTTGAQGRFRLATKGKEPKGKTENTDPNAQKPKATKKAAAKKSTETLNEKGTTKKKDAVKKEKPAKKVKADSGIAKVAPAKKPKAKKTTEKEPGEMSHPTKAKATEKEPGEKSYPTRAKTTEKEPGEKSYPTKAKTKAAKSEVGDVKPAGKRGKKTAE